MTIGIEANHANKQQRTGVENYCWHLIDNLKKQIPSDVRVILYAQSKLLPGLADNMPGNWEVKILKWPLKKLWSQIRLSWELFLNPPDVFFAPGQLIPFFCPKNTVATVHDSAFAVFPGSYRFFGRQYLKWMNKRISKKAKIILTPSHFSKKEFNRLYKFSLEKIAVTPLGFDKNVFNGEKKHEYKEFLFDKPFVFYVGRLEEKKNIVGLLEVFEKIKQNFDIKLVLAGKPGFGFEKIALKIENSLYQKDIITLGWISNEQIAYCLQKSLFFVFPSLYEGFGLPLLEAMACGCPILAVKGHSLEEVGDEAVEFFDLNKQEDFFDKFRILLSDENRRNLLKERGFLRVQEYSWEKTALLTREILCGLQN